VIDDRNQVERLVPKLREALPLVATLSPPLVAIVREQSLDTPDRCAVTRIDYAGDEGGIMCDVTLAHSKRDGDRERALFVSITYLRFDRRQPCAREIAAYQKHRNKRLRIVNAIRDPEDL
jgi:hypothetical protein